VHHWPVELAVAIGYGFTATQIGMITGLVSVLAFPALALTMLRRTSPDIERQPTVLTD
jgi:hypothetical protein